MPWAEESLFAQIHGPCLTLPRQVSSSDCPPRHNVGSAEALRLSQLQSCCGGQSAEAWDGLASRLSFPSAPSCGLRPPRPTAGVVLRALPSAPPTCFSPLPGQFHLRQQFREESKGPWWWILSGKGRGLAVSWREVGSEVRGAGRQGRVW